ncbi:MAG: ferritin-like domain-containing protein [Caldilineaceae bacterium]|nr:ferritin-like domain-containing protein [Caldilineaceae bacterium]
MMYNSLKDLFVEQLRDLYDAEHQISRALPKMANAASSTELKEAFNMHLDQTRTQIQRLERIFSDLGMAPQGENCEAMKGIIKEGDQVINAQGDPNVKDAALITAAQRVEHYEIAGYGSVRTYAKELGYSDAADLLQKTLDEEGSTDSKLTKLAEGGLFAKGINEKADRR